MVVQSELWTHGERWSLSCSHEQGVVVLLPSETLSGVELLLSEDVCTLAFDIERIYLYVTDCI